MVSADIQNGRQRIYTDVEQITKDNVIDVLRKTYAKHRLNANDFDLLDRFEKGEQPLVRNKTYRPEINIQVVDNLAHSVSTYWRSLKWGTRITLVQNGDLDDKSGTIQKLNDLCDLDGTFSTKQEIGRWAENGGYGLEYVGENENWEDGEPYHYTTSLDPRTAYCIYSSYYPDKRKMMAVTYRKDSIGNMHYTCITPDYIFEVINMLFVANGEEAKEEKWYHTNRSGIKNKLGVINIIEWQRDIDLTGVFERQVDAINSLNIMESDFANDVDQNTQSIWLGVDIDVGEDAEGKTRTIKNGEFVWTFSTENGKPSLTPQTIPYDYSGMQNHIVYKKQQILELCNVPCRNDNSGGSTTGATENATGLATSEMIAGMLSNLQRRAYKDEIKVILSVIKHSRFLKDEDKDLLGLKASDIKVSIGRLKSYEITTKVNALCTLAAHGFDMEEPINDFNIFTDPNEVWLKSKDGIKAYQDSIFNKNNVPEGADGEKSVNSDRLSQDMSDQVTQSPYIDGTSINQTPKDGE